MATFDIETREYEEERHVFEMWRWINAKHGEMRAIPDCDADYFKQRGKNVKKLIEEAIPVASLGLSFVGPMDDVYVRCAAGNQPYDATLRVTGFRSLDIKVEVTTTETEETVFARRQLAEHGFTYRPARFEIVGRVKVALPPEMADQEELCEEWIGLAIERAEKKVASGSYDPATAILVRMDNWSQMSMRHRAALVARTRGRLGRCLSSVHGIYYLHRNAVDAVRGSITDV